MPLNRRFFLVNLLVLSCYLPCPPVKAQSTISISPAHFHDPRILQVNPAAIAVSPPHAFLGLKLIYPGLVDNNAFAIKSSLFNLAVPEVAGSKIAAGLHGRFFTTPLYDQSRVGIAAARRLGDHFGIGVDLAFQFNRYATENFDLVDADDPVFQNGASLSVFDPGAGVYFQPNDKISLAASVLHFTRPDLALGSQTSRQPIEALLGIGLTHDFARFDLAAHYWLDQFRPLFGAELFASEVGRLRLGFALNNALLEGQINLLQGASMFYSFSLPTSDLGLVTAGSHEFGLVYVFGTSKKDVTLSEHAAPAIPEERGNVNEPSLPILSASIRSTVETVTITEMRRVREELPLIPLLFFVHNSTALAESRYDLLSESHKEKFHESVHEINAAYRNLLNIIASRLRSQPQARVVIRGYSPGPPIEENSERLALERARFVRNHLTTVLKVPEGQIEIEIGKPDLREASSHDPLRLEELQRVELVVDANYEEIVLAPIMSEKREIETLQKRCGFIVSNLKPGMGVKAWSLPIVAGTDTIEVLSGASLTDTIWWDWRGNPKRPSVFWDEVRYRLDLIDEIGQSFSTAWQKIRSRRLKDEAQEIEKIPIILFGFDEYELDRTSQRLKSKLKQIATKLATEPNSRCELFGHTDAIGEVEHNLELSIQRAQNVYSELARLGIAETRMSFSGHGESQPLADNRLPEGRMLNRRVEVHILHGEGGMRLR